MELQMEHTKVDSFQANMVYLKFRQYTAGNKIKSLPQVKPEIR